MAVDIEFKSRAPGQRREPSYGNSDPGQGLAGWLRERLLNSGIEVGELTRYDWGIEIAIRAKGCEYFAGLPGRKEPDSNWHLFVDKRMSIRDRVIGRVMPADEPMVVLIKEIIELAPQFKLVRVLERH